MICVGLLLYKNLTLTTSILLLYVFVFMCARTTENHKKKIEILSFWNTLDMRQSIVKERGRFSRSDNEIMHEVHVCAWKEKADKSVLWANLHHKTIIAVVFSFFLFQQALTELNLSEKVVLNYKLGISKSLLNMNENDLMLYVYVRVCVIWKHLSFYRRNTRGRL